ncbi:MAG: PHP domain-containing protein [Crocinitomicaceae bacterium]|nr:PHP domain-containing protein [Crocinitomicaceae bacterium]
MYLNTHTYYSLRYGAFSPESLLQLAQQHGFSTIALTDINSTSACLEFIREAQKTDVKPVVGVDFRNGVQQQFILLARNNAGFENINNYLTEVLHTGVKVPEKAPQLEDTFVIYPFQRGKKYKPKKNEFIGIAPADIPSIRLDKFKTRKCVILQSVTFRDKKDFNAHRLLRAIDNNTLLSKLPLSEQASPDHIMYPRNVLFELYEESPEIILNTDKVLNGCSIFFDFSEKAEQQNQQTYTGSVEEDISLLYSLCEKGLDYRYPKMDEEISQRIEKELTAIIDMGFVSYFLINWDIVSYARSKDYFYVGRGSGANSVVAYLLRITDVDPIELDLYFERFINLYRKNPPDFDIDFSWRDRDDVTRYIFERFKNVALVATYNTFKDRGVIRELGKVFGLPKEEIDRLSKGENPQSQLAELVLKYGRHIHGFPNNLSVHSCGIIISEKPIAAFTATFMPPKGYPTIQFDMHISEDVGLYKFDILSQRGLSKIKDALDVIEYNQPDHPPIDIHDIKQFKEDEKIKTVLREAKPIGCFYVESPAMRMLLTKLQVDDYLGLVAASSVIRPGVAQSGMMQEYIKRFRNPERRKDAHPVLLELMPETYGVMVYQEDVIKVAHYFAGLNLGEADKMRRGMSGKFRSRAEFQAVKDKFFKNCTEKKGHSYELTAEVWRQTESFAGYAFAKGHSASYAVESYQCLFLKAYYPLEFLVATINNYGGFYNTELYALEVRLFGGVTHAPCVNFSDIQTTIYGKDIFLGFHLLKSFETQIAKKITSERAKNGDFISFDDFIERVPISLEQISTLIRINAFRFTERDKRSLMWEAHLKISKNVTTVEAVDLFRVQPKKYEIPTLHHSAEEDAFDQIELLGFPLHDPFKLLVDTTKKGKFAKELPALMGKDVWIKGYLIHTKKTVTSNGQLMYFGTFLDEEGQWLDTVHFPDVAARYRFRGKGVYHVYGTVMKEYDAITVEAKFMEKLDMIEDPRYAEIKNQKGDVVTWNNRKDYGERRKNAS